MLRAAWPAVWLVALGTAIAQVEPPDLIKQLRSLDPPTRDRAAQAIADLGPGAWELVPQLVALLDETDDWVAYLAREALEAIGKPAHDHLVKALQQDSLRLAAAEILFQTGDSGIDALELYLASMPAPDAQLEVLSILGSIGFDRVLGMVEQEPASGLRALRRLRTRGRHFRRPNDFSEIIEAEVEDEDLRHACKVALTVRGRLEREVLDRALTWIEGTDPALRETGAWAVGVSWQESLDAVSGLTTMLSAKEPVVRMTAAWALGQVLPADRVNRAPPPGLIVCGHILVDAPFPMPAVGTDYQGYWELLTMGAKPIPSYVRDARRLALLVDWVDSFPAEHQFKPRDPPRGRAAKRFADLVPKLTALLDDPNAEVVRAAAWSLGTGGPLASPAATKLAALLSSEDRRIRREAATALADLGRAAEGAKDLVVRSLWDGGGPLEVYFLATLGEDALHDLVDALGHPNRIAAEFAIMALGRMDGEPVDFLEPLAAAFRNGQYMAAGLLVRTGDHGERVLAEVLAGDYLSDLQGVSAYALRYCRRASAKTLEALRNTVDSVDADHLLKSVAKETLRLLD